MDDSVDGLATSEMHGIWRMGEDLWPIDGGATYGLRETSSRGGVGVPGGVPNWSNSRTALSAPEGAAQVIFFRAHWDRWAGAPRAAPTPWTEKEGGVRTEGVADAHLQTGEMEAQSA